MIVPMPQVSDPIRLVRMVNEIDWLKQASKKNDPLVLVTRVKQISRLRATEFARLVAKQSDSPSGRAGWGLGMSIELSASGSISLTIHARWMGSKPTDLITFALRGPDAAVPAE